MAKKIRKQGTRVKHTTRKAAAARPATSSSVFDRLGGGIVPIVLSVVLLICIGIVFLLTYETISASNFFHLRDVTVAGTDRALASDIEKIVISNAEKAGVWNADLHAIKQKVESVTFVKTAAVSRRLPSGLNVTVTERVPVAVVRLGGGDFLADGEGVILAPANADEKQIPFAMLGWSEEKSEKAAKENSERLKMYQKMLNEWKDYDLAKRVKQVDISDLREPKATLEDSGMPVTIMLSRDNFGKQLAEGIKAIVGKGAMFEGVNLVGQNLVLVPRKQAKQ